MSGQKNGEDKPKAFYWDWTDFLRSTRLSSGAKLVGLSLALYAHYSTGRNAHPGVTRLAGDTSLSAKTVQRALAELVDAGLVLQRSRGGSTAKLASVYDLVSPSVTRAIISQGDRSPEEDHQSQ